MTVTQDTLVFRQRWPLFLRLPGGFSEYSFPRHQVVGLSLRPGAIFRDWGALRVIHSVDQYASDFTYSTEHLSDLREAFDEFGWVLEDSEQPGG